MFDYSSAQAFYSQSRYQECVACCIQILSSNPSDFKTWKLCAFALYALGEKSKAIEYLRHSLNLCGDDLFSWISLGEMYRKVGEPEKTIQVLSALLPNENANLHFNLARAYSDLKDDSRAIKHYRIVLKINPNDAQALHNLGNHMLALKDFKSALSLFKKSFELGFEDAGINLAYVYGAIFEEKKALEIYKNLAVRHSQDAYFYFNYANTLWATLDFEEAQKMYQKAISLLQVPIFYINYSYLLLSLGHYQEGFKYYQKRLLLPNILPLKINPNCLNRPFEGKSVLVYHEQGFGDSIMFSRFLDQLILKTKEVKIYPQKPLYELFALKWGKRVKQKSEIGVYESAFSLLSLPAILGTTEIRLEAEQVFFSKIKKIGVFFSSNQNFVYSSDKSIPPERLLKSLKGFDLYSLQPEGIDEGLCKKFGVKDLSFKIKNFKDTLNELKKLDLLVSVDSAIVHLAGTYQIPTIVLLHKKYDWRWGKIGQVWPIKSPWYNSIIGIAQEHSGDWDSVLQILERYLKDV